MPSPTEVTSTAKRSWTCEEAGITVTLPKPMTSNAKAEGRFGKQDFRYVADEDVYVCPAGEKLAYRYTTEENDRSCALILDQRLPESRASNTVGTTGKEMMDQHAMGTLTHS